MTENEFTAQKNEEEEPRKGFSAYASIAAVQAVCVAIILIALLVVKLLFPSLFSDIKKNYEKHFLTETSISEVMEEDEITESEAGVSEV